MTLFSLVGLKFLDIKGDRRLYHGKRRLEIAGFSLRTLEIVSLYPEGVEMGSLHHKVARVTGKDIPLRDLEAALREIEQAFLSEGLPYWKTAVRRGTDGRKRHYYQIEGAIPRHPSTWPAYLDPIRPSSGGNSKGDDPNIWRQHAACQVLDPEIFYPNETGEDASGYGRGGIWLAKLACSMCTVRDQCAAWEISVEQKRPGDRPQGIFGGLTPQNRVDAKRIATDSSAEAAEAFLAMKQTENARAAETALWARIRPKIDRKTLPFTLTRLATTTLSEPAQGF